MAAKTLGSAAGGLFSRTSLPAKQQSLAARIGRYADMDDDAFFQEMEEFENLIEESRGFRHLAPTTQARQDSILASCLAMVRHMNRLPDNFDDEATEALAFPNDKNKLLRQVQHYLISIYKSSHGRGANVNHRMRYETFVQYREALLFWIRYKFDLRNMEPPHQSWMFNNISMTMRLVQSKFGIQDRRDVKEGLGLVELRQLLEHEMTTNLSVKVSEHHQLIWCIGRQTAVRPGSIGWSKGRKDRYLRWADVGFRNLGDGKFTCILKIKHLKTNYQNPERGTHRQLNFTIASPNAENLIFSVPHRLLVIALRRSLLVGIESLEDLLKSQNAYILIKDANLDDPVFYRSLPAGRGLDMSPGHNKTQALSASAISCYLADRGRALGYTEPVSMYSIRHRTATDLAVRVGHATAREIMGHDPGTYTLERYYLNVLPLVDLAGATLDQRISPNGISAEALTEYAPLAQTALSSAKMQQIQGVALRNFVEEICSKDPAFPVNGDTNTRRLYLKRARAYALRTLVNEAHQESVRTVTVNEIEARQKSWTHDAAMFAKRIQEAATAFASASSAQRQMMMKFKDQSKFNRHLATFISDPNIDPEHFELMALDGWDDPGFKGIASIGAIQTRARHNVIDFARAGVDISFPTYSKPFVDSTYPGLTFGHVPVNRQTTSPHLLGRLRWGDDSTTLEWTETPAQFAGNITWGKSIETERDLLHIHSGHPIAKHLTWGSVPDGLGAKNRKRKRTETDSDADHALQGCTPGSLTK